MKSIETTVADICAFFGEVSRDQNYRPAAGPAAKEIVAQRVIILPPPKEEPVNDEPR